MRRAGIALLLASILVEFSWHAYHEPKEVFVRPPALEFFFHSGVAIGLVLWGLALLLDRRHM